MDTFGRGLGAGRASLVPSFGMSPLEKAEGRHDGRQQVFGGLALRRSTNLFGRKVKIRSRDMAGHYTQIGFG